MNVLRLLVKISFITMISRVLGFIRDVLMASSFGAGMAMDAFCIAFKFPNLLRRIFAEGAFSQAFIPILVEYKHRYGDRSTSVFVSYVSGLLIFTLFLLTVIGCLAAPWIVMIFAPGFIDTQEQFALTIAIVRITFPYIFLISLVSFIGAILNTWNYFLIPAFSPILLNISMISFTLLAHLAGSLFNPPIMALAWSILFGGVFQLVYQLPYLKRIGMLVVPNLQLNNSGVWRVLRLMGPAIIAASSNQISLIINTIFASFLVSGSISWLYYADRLMEFPTGVLGVAFSSILLPALSRSFAKNNYYEYSCLINWGLKLGFLLAVPSAIILGILAQPLTIALFQYGKFSSFDALMTQYAIIAYSIGIIGFILVKILASAFYSCYDVKSPTRIVIITLVITQVMNLFFISFFKHAGLALSVGLGSNINAALLYLELRKKKIFKLQPGWFSFFLRLLLAVIVMSMTLIGLLMVVLDWAQGGMLFRLFRLVGVILGSILIYLFMLWILGIRWRDFIIKSNINLSD